MAQAIAAAINGASGKWDVVTYDWSADAGTIFNFGPGTALRNAPTHGINVALQLEEAARQYDYIHFIAHSAGSQLIQYAVDELRIVDANHLRARMIHSTFLDPYNPNFEDYGAGSDCADTYYTNNDFPSTPSNFLPHASDVDVTEMNRDAFPAGNVCSVPTAACRASHSWPHEWYTRTVTDAPAGVGTWGFKRSFEGSGRYPEYDSAHHEGAPPYVLPQPVQVDTPSTTVVDLADAANNPIDLASIASLVSPSGEVGVDSTSASLLTGSPVWMSALVTTSSVVNTLRLDYDFESGGDGWLSVFVDNELVFKGDQRNGTGVVRDSGPLWLGSDLPSGDHLLTLHLAPFGTAESQIVVSNIRLSQRTVACSAVDKCHAAGTWDPLVLACSPGTTLACDDGDQCTEDTCDPQQGCVYTLQAGYTGALCRLDSITAALTAAASDEIAASLRPKLQQRVAKVRAKVAAAAQHNPGKRAVRLLAGAIKQLKAIDRIVRVKAGKKLSPPFADVLRHFAQTLGQALATLRANATP